MGALFLFVIIVGILWFLRVAILKDTSARIKQREAEKDAGFCEYPRKQCG